MEKLSQYRSRSRLNELLPRRQAFALPFKSQYRSRSRLNEQGLLQGVINSRFLTCSVWILTDNALRLRFVSFAKVRIFRQ